MKTSTIITVVLAFATITYNANAKILSFVVSQEEKQNQSLNQDQNPNQSDTTNRVEPIKTIDVMPKFKGGSLMEYRQWVSSRLKYPIEAFNRNIEGKVLVQFVVEKDGSIGDIAFRQTSHQMFADEVHRVLLLSPKWEPGMNNGKVVRVQFVLPFEFRLRGR